jgi:hypothetical protein
MKKLRLFQKVLTALLFSSLLVGCNTFLSQETSTLQPVVSTETLKPTFTPTVTSTPNPTMTPSPSPTKTATPVPGWVTDFAEPILAAIADRPPDFEEDFTEAGPGWYLEKVNCPNNGCVIKDGVLSMAAFPVNFSYAWAEQSYPCCQGFKSFVLRVDVNTAKLDGENSAFITYNDVLRKGGRSTTISEYGFELKSDRRWFSLIGQSGMYGGDNGQLPRSVPPQITFTLISRGSRFAVYLNDIPVTYGECAGGQNQPEFSLRAYSYGSGIALVEYDNLKIWNLDNIPDLP